jgi:hypothetical protein
LSIIGSRFDDILVSDQVERGDQLSAMKKTGSKMKTLRLDRGQIEVVDDKVAEILKTKSGRERLNMVWDT